MRNSIEAQSVSGPRERRIYRITSTFLGLLGAINLLLIAFYSLSIFFLASAIPLMEKLTLAMFLASALDIISAAMLIYGSCQIYRTRLLRGGMINLVAGTMPIPVYVYFALFSQPNMLGWLGVSGCFLLFPGPISGMASIFLAD